jgi:hypothetical protein
MNKLLVFPLTFMFLLTIFSLLYIGGRPYGDSPDYSSPDETNITGSEAGSGTVQLPDASSHKITLLAGGVLLLIAIAITVGIISGFHILGSGFSATSQSMIINAILFMGLWAVLAVIASDIIFQGFIAVILWMIITVMYVIGFAIHINPSGGV